MREADPRAHDVVVETGGLVRRVVPIAGYRRADHDRRDQPCDGVGDEERACDVGDAAETHLYLEEGKVHATDREFREDACNGIDDTESVSGFEEQDEVVALCGPVGSGVIVDVCLGIDCDDC